MRLRGDLVKEWPSYAIMGTGAAGILWLFWATWHGIDPIGWFR
jgi:hypothetical protein